MNSSICDSDKRIWPLQEEVAIIQKFRERIRRIKFPPGSQRQQNERIKDLISKSLESHNIVDFAEINIWGETEGAVRWDNRKQLASFQYRSSFIKHGWELAPFTMPLSASRVYEFLNLKPRPGEPHRFMGLPGLIADSLPDNYGNQLIDGWLAEHGRSTDSMNPVEKLCFIGKRGMGTLEFESVRPAGAKKSFSIEIDALVNIAARMLEKQEHSHTDLSADEKEAMTEVLKVGTSAGGARPKAVITHNPKTQEVRSGQADAPRGFEYWMIKLDGVSDTHFGQAHGYGRVEMAYHDMAVDCGIDMMPSRLLEENGRAHFMTQRFDRGERNEKHPIQTFCALKHYDYNQIFSYSYEQLFQCMRELRLDYQDAEQMFRRMVFNVMSTNCIR